MKYRGPIFFSLVVAGLMWVGWYQPLKNAEKEAVLIHTMLEGINRFHFSPKPIDDDFSAMAWDLYLKRLDGAKRWLTGQDIEQLAPWKYQIDDQAEAGRYEFFDLSVQLFSNALDKTQQWYREILAQPFDFSKEETVELDGEKRPWALDDAALREYWRKWLKYETLTRLHDKQEQQAKGEDEELAGKTFEELEAMARKEVLDMMDNWYTRLKKRKRPDHLSVYLNAITNIFDPHTSYYKPIDKQNFDISMSGKLEGIGARLQADGEYTKVVEVVVGGPAWKQGGLEENDRILKVAQEGEEPVEVTGMTLDEVVQLIRGPKGTKVTLTVKKADGSIKDITIVRDVVIFEEGFAKSLLLENEHGETIGYIWLPRFYADFEDPSGRQCARDVAREVEKLKNHNVDGIIIDLRNNGGGSLRDVVEMTGLFIEKGPIVQVKSRGRRPVVLDDEDPGVAWDGPLVVMVNSFSASASEIMAAALQDYRRAVIVGSKSTFGKGTVQRFFDLDRALPGHNDLKPLGQIKITMQKFYRINGGATQLRGVTPDINLPDQYQYIDVGEKEQDYPLPWSQIEPVKYEQDVYVVKHLDKIRKAAEARLARDTVWQKILAHAQWVKEQQDHTSHPLSLEKWEAETEAEEAYLEAYDKLFDREVIHTVRNLDEDLDHINSDEGRKARNEEWIKNLKKDVYVAETLRIMHDLIRYH